MQKKQFFSDRYTDKELGINFTIDMKNELNRLLECFYLPIKEHVSKYNSLTEETSNERLTWRDLREKYNLEGKPKISNEFIENASSIMLFDLIESWNLNTNDDEFAKAVNYMFENNNQDWRLVDGELVEENELIFDFKNFIEQAPTYKKIEILKCQTKSLRKELNRERKLKIDAYCQKCKKERIFDEGYLQYASHQQLCFFSVEPQFFYTFFTCSYCNETHFVAFIINDWHIIKIGQYPSPVNVSKAKYKKYEKLLGKYYNELINATFASAAGLNVGAFVYLRRILEHLIEEKYAKLPKTKKQVKTNFNDKLKAVDEIEKIIPEGFTSARNSLYEHLSKGIHQYEESKCEKLFPFIKMIIELILDKELEKKEQKKKIDDAKRILGNEERK